MSNCPLWLRSLVSNTSLFIFAEYWPRQKALQVIIFLYFVHPNALTFIKNFTGSETEILKECTRRGNKNIHVDIILKTFGIFFCWNKFPPNWDNKPIFSWYSIFSRTYWYTVLNIQWLEKHAFGGKLSDVRRLFQGQHIKT